MRLTGKRTTLSSETALRLLSLSYLVILLWHLFLLVFAFARGLAGRMDFVSFYTGGTIILQGLGPRLYDLAFQTRVQRAILGPEWTFRDGVLPFNNPPQFALAMVPFSLLPLNTAFGLWTALGLVTAGWAIRRLLRLVVRWNRQEYRMALLGFWALPPLGLALLHGQPSPFVLLCLTEWTIALKEGREFRAGVWLALAAIKPQAILFPALAVLAARRWRALAGAGSAGLVILVGTAAALGPSIWPDYLRWLAETGSYFGRFGVYPQVMYNLKGTLTLWLGAERAFLIQAISAGALAVGTVVILALWARTPWISQEPGFDFRLVFTVTLGALLSLHQNQHDTLVLALPAVLFYDALRRTGCPTRTAAAFLLSWPLLAFMEEFALRGILGIRLPVLLMAILAGWAGERALAASEFRFFGKLRSSRG